MQSHQDATEHGRELVDQQRAETGASGTVGPSTPALPDSMARGLWRGGALGAVIGAIVLTPIALFDWFDLPLIGRLAIVWIVGAAAGAAAGAVFFGGAVAEDESEDGSDANVDVPEQMHRSHGEHRHLD